MDHRKIMLNRCLAVMLILVLTITLLPTAETQAKTAQTAVNMKAKSVTKYMNSLDDPSEDEVYYNGKGDIPYFELNSRLTELEEYLNFYNPSGITLNSKIKGNTVTWSRKTDSGSARVIFDFKKNTITFDDLNAFFWREGSSLVGCDGYLKNNTDLIQRDEKSSYDQKGKRLVIDLNKYGIKLLRDEKNYYIPIQTYSDLFYSRFLLYLVFNGENIFISTGTSLGELFDLYKSVEKKKYSKEFAEFNYGELCLMFDYLYGMKENHGIKSFDEFFKDTGLDSLIKSRDATGTDLALYEALVLYIDDLHSGLMCTSYNTDSDKVNSLVDSLPKGSSYSGIGNTWRELTAYREKQFPDGILPYQEVGDTAYITFDVFWFENAISDCSDIPTDEDLPDLGSDTFRLVQYAVNKITNNPEIKNVVLDLSLNGGGMVLAGIYLMAAFLGTGSLAMKDMTTEARSIASFMADTNIDGVFDEMDTLADRGLNLYCITSGYSISTSNFVATAFKESGKVTLVGRTTGGAPCSVCYVSSASGSILQISGPSCFGFYKNGVFYDADRGVEPDVYIKDMSMIYDREKLSKYLKSIK